MLERESSALEDMVHQARDSLFDEELFHQLSAEARGLLAHGVKEKSGCIIVPLSKGKNRRSGRQPTSSTLIVIDLVDRGEPLQAQGHFAESIAMFLRLGLNHTYRERHDRRIRPPAPLSNTTNDTGATKLLMSIVTLDEHHRAVQALREGLAGLLTPLTTAGVPYSFNIERDLDLAVNKTGKGRMMYNLTSQSFLQKLFASSQGPQTTLCDFKLQSAADIVLRTSTNFIAPQYGTTHMVESSSVNPESMMVENTSEGLRKVQGHFAALVQKSLIRYLAGANPDWSASADDTELLSNTHDGRRLSLRLTGGGLTVCLTASDPDKGPTTLILIEGKRIRKAPGITASSLVDVLQEAAHVPS